MFFFKKKEVVLDAFTFSEAVFKYAKVDTASKFYPEWWKNLPKNKGVEFFPTPTMKTCDGIVNLYNTGFVIPLWSEISILVGKQGTGKLTWQYADYCSDAIVHPNWQYDNYYPVAEYAHLKLTTPWRFICNRGTQFSWSQPTFSMKSFKDYVVLPGVVNYIFNRETNINLFFIRDKEEDKVVNLEFNQPLVHLVPITDNKVKIKHHLISEDEYNKLQLTKRHFINSNKQLSNLKCPFHSK